MAEGSERKQLRRRALVKFPKFQNSIHCQLRPQILGAEPGCGVPLESLSELFYASGFEGNAGGVAMAAETNEQVRHRFQSL